MEKHSYRISRNIEKSILDAISNQLTVDDWAGVGVEKVYPETKQVPCILVQLISETSEDLELGSKTTRDYPLIMFRIFAVDDGQRLDLKDWLKDLIKNDFEYYEYVIDEGKIIEKNLKGKIRVRRITRNEKEYENTEGLSNVDKYRHVIGVEVEVKEF